MNQLFYYLSNPNKTVSYTNFFLYFIKPEFNCMQSVEMKVFDTWGSLLYSESGATLTGWNGAFKGKPSENGNYIMNVNATTLYGAVIEYNGPFILIK